MEYKIISRIEYHSAISMYEMSFMFSNFTEAYDKYREICNNNNDVPSSGKKTIILYTIKDGVETKYKQRIILEYDNWQY